MPKIGTHNRQIAQAGAETPVAGETHESVGHKEETENPLAEHAPLAYSLNAGIVAIILIIFAAILGRNLQKRPVGASGKRQMLGEWIIEWLDSKVPDSR